MTKDQKEALGYALSGLFLGGAIGTLYARSIQPKLESEASARNEDERIQIIMRNNAEEARVQRERSSISAATGTIGLVVLPLLFGKL